MEVRNDNTGAIEFYRRLGASIREDWKINLFEGEALVTFS